MQTQLARSASAPVRWYDMASSCRFTSSGNNYDDEWIIRNTFGMSVNRPLLIECKSKRAERPKMTEILIVSLRWAVDHHLNSESFKNVKNI